MLAVLGFIGAMFALFWAGLFATIGLVVLFAFLIPFLIVALFFRIGFVFVKLAAVLLLVCLIAVSLV